MSFFYQFGSQKNVCTGQKAFLFAQEFLPLIHRSRNISKLHVHKSIAGAQFQASTLSLRQSCGHTRAAAWELFKALCDARSLQDPAKTYPISMSQYSSQNQRCTDIRGVQYQDRCDQQGAHAACRINLFSESSLDLSVLKKRQARSTTTLSSMSSGSASSMAMNSGFADVFSKLCFFN